MRAMVYRGPYRIRVEDKDVPRIEHAAVTPVCGTTCPLHGVSGRLRRYSCARFSEARAAHWLILMAADRVDVVEHRLHAVVRR